MSYTALTAVIITFHDASTITALTIALILSTLIFWLFLKRRKNRLIALLLTFIFTFILGSKLTERLYERKPISFEIVQAG